MPSRSPAPRPSRRSPRQQKQARSAALQYYQQFVKRAQGTQGSRPTNSVAGGGSTPSLSGSTSPRNTPAVNSGPSLASTIGSGLWNYGGKQVLNPVANTFSGLSTTAVGLANTAAGAIGSGIAQPYRGLTSITDGVGLTRGWNDAATDFQNTMNNAAIAGLKDTVGGAADTLSFGLYDYDNSSLLAPQEGKVTAVEAMRAQHRDQLGRGSGLERAYNFTNAAADFAANTAAAGGAGRGLNVAAKALKAAPTAAPVLNAVARAPGVGRPLATMGNWTAGPAPAYNMFTQTPTQYAQGMMQRGFLPGAAAAGAFRAGAPSAVVAAGGMVDDVARVVHPMANEGVSALGYANAPDRVLENQQQQAYDAQHAQQQEQFAVGTYGMHSGAEEGGVDGGGVDQMASTMMQDPAIQRRIAHGALPQDAAEKILAEQPSYQQAPPEEQAAQMQNAAQTVSDSYTRDAAQKFQTGVAELQQLTADPNANPEQVRTTTASTMQALLSGAPQVKVDEARAFLQESTKTDVAADMVAPASTSAPSSTAAGATTSEAPGAASAKPMSPEAQQFRDQALNNAVAEAQKNAPPETQQNPSAFGEFIGQVVNQFQQMPPEAQAAIGLGLPLALAGVFMGGGGGTLMGLLGLAGAAGGAAYGGLLGEDAQQMVGQFVPGGTRGVGGLMAQAGRAMGKNIPDQADLSMLYKPEEGKELNPLARLQSMTNFNPLTAEGRSNAINAAMSGKKQDIGAELSKLDQLGELAARPDWQAIPLMMHLDPNIENSEQARQALQHARTISTAANDSKQPLYGQIQALRELHKSQQEKKSSVALKIASRCWKGYEPVPGAKPYTRGSCRPKGSKKTQKEMKKS